MPNSQVLRIVRSTSCYCVHDAAGNLYTRAAAMCVQLYSCDSACDTHTVQSLH